MKSRKERTKSERRLMMWSIALAGVAHLVAYLHFAGQPISAVETAEDPVDRLALITGSSVSLDLFFGPPVIRGAEGSMSVEPPERVLGEGRAVFLTSDCKRIIEESENVFHGTVRLSVFETGLVQVGGVEESTGSVCGDYVIARVAADLLYEWLPNDDFPAPVEVVQPLTFVGAT